jgi:lipopolysaccharide/colanic/teichoic acid biosynthesis glycosyltransferase
MTKLIKEFQFFSFQKKALSAALLVVLLTLAVMFTAQAQTVIAEKSVANPNQLIIASQTTYDTTHRGRAPEPSTVALMGSAFMAGIVRFARRRFAEFKRGFDVAVAAVGLVLSFPVVLISALAIKIFSPGPVFFRQTRVGRNGEIFDMLKLRTMICDAEKTTGAVWATENDPRITSVGKFLRKSRIDEIPQLVNVLRGEMSLIGPRPERPEFVDKLSLEICDYQKRLCVRPGITGLAQIKQSYDATIKDVRRKVKFDLLYIKRMCFLTDLRILLGTLTVVATGRGAR